MQSIRGTAILMFLLPFMVHLDAQSQRMSPCPMIFSYQRDQRHGHYGHMVIRNDRSGKFEVEVNASFPVALEEDQNIKIQLVTGIDKLVNGPTVEYDVVFPVQDAQPKITQIKYNGLVVCKGPPHNLVPGGTVTSVWAKTMASIGGGGKSKPAPPGRPSYPNYGGGYGGAYDSFRDSLPSGSADFQDKNAKAETRRSVETCGMARNSQNLVVGGEQTSSGDFPWLVAILYRQGNDYKFKCTGNLVSDRHVITAGHCLRYYNAPLISDEDLIIILGKHNIENWAHGSVIRNVKEVLVHPDYKQDNSDSDAAIIVLNEAVQFTPDIRPVCLWSGGDDVEDIVGKPGTVVGWGKNKDNLGFASVAMKVDMPVIAQEKCIRSNKVFKKLISNKTFCAGNRNGKGPCTGDSGAGFIIQNDETKQWMLRGLTGYTLKDTNTQSCDLNNFVVFTDVSKVQNWVKNVIGAS